jgi:hypothetical protein
MKSKLALFSIIVFTSAFFSCSQNINTPQMNIVYLHHSTGGVIWYGKEISLATRAANKITNRITGFGTKAELPSLFNNYNKEEGKNYTIKEIAFPKAAPYGWNNNPYDYYNIWVRNAGDMPYKEEPTLEILTKEYQVIIFKHCFPVSNIQPEQDSADINSNLRTISNYKLQYSALRDKLHQFPDVKFILFTGAAQVKGSISEDEAGRAKEFFTWVVQDWDEPGDNIYLWDLYNLETEGELYFNDKYATSFNDSHPNGNFAGKAVKLLFNRIIDVVENNGNGTSLTGKKL